MAIDDFVKESVSGVDILRGYEASVGRRPRYLGVRILDDLYGLGYVGGMIGTVVGLAYHDQVIAIVGGTWMIAGIMVSIGKAVMRTMRGYSAATLDYQANGRYTLVSSSPQASAPPHNDTGR